MKPSVQLQKSGHSQFKMVLLVGTFFLLAGMGLSALYFRGKSQASPAAESDSSATLSATTAKILQGLDSPMEIRFYSLLDTSTVPASVQAFAGRVDQMLDLYEQEAGGKLKITRYTTANSNAKAAVKDGMSPFNVAKGDASYLGMTIVRGGKTETIPYLAPEWEQAMEADVTRAVDRVSRKRTRLASTTPVPASAATTGSVKQIIPNVDSVTLEQGTQLLREAALAEFKKAGEESQVKVKELQQQFIAAQSDSDKQHALEALKNFQAAQTEQLKQIAASSKAQIDAFTQIKTGH